MAEAEVMQAGGGGPGSSPLPIALWLLVGIAYAGGGWGETEVRMHFIRFSGEPFIYYALFTLILLGSW